MTKKKRPTKELPGTLRKDVLSHLLEHPDDINGACMAFHLTRQEVYRIASAKKWADKIPAIKALAIANNERAERLKGNILETLEHGLQHPKKIMNEAIEWSKESGTTTTDKDGNTYHPLAATYAGTTNRQTDIACKLGVATGIWAPEHNEQNQQKPSLFNLPPPPPGATQHVDFVVRGSIRTETKIGESNAPQLEAENARV